MEKSIGRKRKREKARKETNGNEKERDRANYRERRIPRNVGLHRRIVERMGTGQKP